MGAFETAVNVKCVTNVYVVFELRVGGYPSHWVYIYIAVGKFNSRIFATYGNHIISLPLHTT